MKRRGFLAALLGTAAAQTVIAKLPPAVVQSIPPLRTAWTLYISQKARDRLQKKFLFREVCERTVRFPPASGKTLYWYRYSK